MLLRRLLLGSTFIASVLAGCAHKPTAPATQPAAAVATPTPAPASPPPPPPAPETPPPAPPPPPECSAPADCASKGEAAKGMQWACIDTKCSEEKKPVSSKKKGKK